MAAVAPGRLKRWMAKVCLNCPVCRRARRTQQGWAYDLVKKVEHRACPFCRAYAEVTGRPAYEFPSQNFRES
jgi:hypothetical protein